MKLSELIIKVGAVVLIIVGFSCLLALVGLPILGISAGEPFWNAIVGVAFLGVGIHLARGGSVSL